MKKALILIALLPAVAFGQTFATSSALPAAVPDGTAYCLPGTNLTLTIPVSGLSQSVSSLALNFTMSPAHTWYGDLKCTITAPSGATAVVMKPYCEGGVDDPSNVGGPYTLSDAGAATFDSAAVAAANGSTIVIPAGTYRGTGSLNSLLVCGTVGNWTVTFRDFSLGETGSVSALSLVFGTGTAVVESFTICQGGAGQPVNLSHRGGPAYATYANPCVLNTPSAIPNGWLYGLNIPWLSLLDEMSQAPPWFSGTLDGSGASFVSIPNAPAGISVQIVGLHINPTTGVPVFSSPPVSFTIN